MADVNANIGINIDSSNALAQLKALQRQISQFHTSIARSSEAAALAQKGLQKNLLNSINAIGSFTAEMRTVRTSAESFTNSLEKNKFSMREYFRYAGASTKTFGRLFKSEFDTIGKVAEERVKRLQTQYIKMGRDTNGAMRAMGVMPTQLDMNDYTTKVQIAAQKQALFNQLMKQGSTNLLNFGKNTQWAGRQLMVGFTLPLMLVGSTAVKTFMEMEAQALRFRKVYGDLFTPQSETQAALDSITELGQQFTKYGVAVSTTVGLAAEAAAAGFQGLDLQRQTAQATRLSILGQVESQKALETTISLQNAFGMSSDKLAESIDFLNAVENQTVVSLDDITTAIPKVAPVIQQLGGDVKDLTFFMAAMKEGGINASEGANALKSGLAALINPTKKASEMLASYGINATAIVENNKGDLKATVIGFAEALNRLDPLARARAIEQMFGKFQFARLSTLFANVAKDGNQAARVLDLANSSVEDLSALSEQELGMTADSAMNKFKKSVEDLKFALVPVGEAFLQALTPIVEFVGGILEKFGNLSDGTKKIITLLTVGIGAIGPVLLMTFGLLANGVANIIKLFLTLRGGYQRLTGQSQILGEQTQYMTMEQLDAAAAAHSLNQTHANLTQTFTAEANAIRQLINSYNSAAGAARNFAANNPRMMMPGKATKKFAQGGMISGPGGSTSDSVPVMASNGEAIISAKTVKKYPGIIQGLISGNIPGFKRTGIVGGQAQIRLQDSYELGHFAPPTKMLGSELQEFAKTQTQSVKDTIDRLILSVQDGLEHAFDVFTNEVVVQSTELNQAIGEVGSGDKANKSLFREEAVAGAGAYNAPLLAKMKDAGASPEELKVAVNNLAEEFDKGITDLGDQTTVTAEEINKITQEAYDTVAKTNKQVKAAREELRKPGVMKEQFGAVKTGGRTQFKGAYSSKTNRTKVNQMVQANVPGRFPTQQAANFTLAAAQEVGIRDAQQIREIYRKLDLEAKKRVEEFVGNVRAMSKQVVEEARKAGIDIGEHTIEGIAIGAQTQSPSKKSKKTGEDIGRGLEEGMKSRQDDVALVGSQLGEAATGGVKGGVGPIPFIQPGQPGSVASNAPRPGVNLNDIAAKARMNRDVLLSTQQQKRMAAMNQRMDKLNKGFMSGTFALSALSGVASMAGGNLGKFSEILFQITGPLFALSSIIQLLTGNKIISIISKFKLGFGLASVALLAGVGIIKLANDARKKELEYIYGLSNAMKTTTDQVKTLGDFFSVVPSKLPFENRNREIVRKDVRSARDRLREDSGFQKQFAPTIQTLSKSTAQEAQLAFTSLALNLKAQGFATGQVQTIVDALREEAGKTDVKLDVKSLDFSPESIKQLQTQIAPLLLNLDKQVKAGLTKVVAVGGGKGGYSAQIVQTNEAKKALSELGTFISETSKSSAGMFRLGIISGTQFEASLYGILETMNGLDEASRKVALIEIFKKLDVDAAPFLKNLQTAKQEMMLLALLSSGALSKDSPTLRALASTDGKTQSRGINRLRVAYENLFGAISKVNEEDKKLDGGGTTGAGKPNALQERIKAIQNQTNAYIILRNAKVDEATATELSNDAEIASLVLANSKGKSLKQIIALVNQYKAALAGQTKAEYQYMSGPNLFKKQLERSQAEADLREKLIDMQFAPQIKKENDALAVQEKRLADINTQIQKVTKSQVEPIQAVIDSNNLALDKIALKEDAINEKYNKQVEALDKIASINQNIANIQKQRLSIADALTRGDISTAAQLMQDARAEQAQSAVTGQKDALSATRDAAISALGRNAIEKQNKELQLQINIIEATQLKTLQAQKQTIEDTIESINLNIAALNKKVEVTKQDYIYAKGTKQEMDDLDDLIAKATAAGIPFTAELLKQAGSAQALAAALASALASQKQLGSGAKTMEEIKAGYNAGTITSQTITPEQKAVVLQSIKDLNAKIKPQIEKLQKLTGVKKMYGGVVKYMATGGAVGSDTIPAMLTPGEFIVNKAASKAYRPLLERINESKYPGMLGGGGMTQIPVNNISTSMNDNSTAVYNYNLGFSINGANGNAKDIANAVMREIKNVDSQRIRGQRR
jgi:TP901 family phage tail tape measure protein